VKQGAAAAGGTPSEFTTITVNDGFLIGHAGMKSSQVRCEVLADSVKFLARGHGHDAPVGLAGCDKTLPELMMAILRINVPSVFLYGDLILPGRFRSKDNAQTVGLAGKGAVTQPGAKAETHGYTDK